ncbi:MAG: SLC13 family permease [Hyphomicrobiales bacterium]
MRSLFAIIATVVVLFIWGRLPVMLVALMVPLALFLGILPLEQVFSGFGNPVVIFIASLFVVAAGFRASGIAAWVCRWLSRAVGDGPVRLSLLTMLLVAVLSPLVSRRRRGGADAGGGADVDPPAPGTVEISHAAGLRVRRRLAAGADRHGEERAGVECRGKVPAMASSASSNSPGPACRCWPARC